MNDAEQLVGKVASLGRAARRQAVRLGAVALIVVVCGTVHGILQRDLYRSVETVAYDPRDAAVVGPPEAPRTHDRFAQIVATFQARLAEPEFLWQVAREVELSLDPASDKPLADDSSTKSKVARILGPTLKVSADGEAETFSVTALAEDPITARRLASAAVELFVARELRFEAETVNRLYEAHKRFLDEGKAPEGGEAARDGDGAFRERLDERVRELDLERRRLTAQIERPEERTRFRVTVPATYDDIPVKRMRRRVVVGWTLFGLMALGLTGFVGERRTPFARQARRVREVTGLPVIGEVPRALLRAGTREVKDPGAAAAWRAIAAGVGAVTGATAASGASSDIVLLAGSRSRELVHQSLAAAPASVPSLVIDGVLDDPMLAASERPRAALGAFLGGKAAWKDVRVTRSAARPYDLVAVRTDDPDGPTGARLDALLAKLVPSLKRGYGRVWVRLDPSASAAEAAAFAKIAAAVVLVVPARTTRLADLSATAAAFDPKTLRGVLLVDT